MLISNFNKLDLESKDFYKLKSKNIIENDFDYDLIRDFLNLCLDFEGVRLDFIDEKEAVKCCDLLKVYFKKKRFVFVVLKGSCVLLYERRSL